MAPPASEHGIPINIKTIAIIVLALAAAAWLWLSNNPPQVQQQPKVIRINATTPAPQPPQQQPQSVVGLLMCRGEAYRSRSGITICGVEMVTDQYIFLRRGWIYAPNSTQFVVVGDISACRLTLGVNTLYLNCTQPVMVVR